jgi:hypothetical protein
MKCAYCGTKKVLGEKYVNDPKNNQNFCSISCLRNWGKNHTGSKYFRAVTKVVTE